MMTPVQILKRYTLLWCAIFKISVIAELEYRANIVGKVLADLVWYTAQLSLFEVLFRHSSSLAGWTLNDMRVFMGALFFVDGLYMVFFHENLDNFSTKIVKGELDLILAKPINSQFMISLGRVNSPYLINVALIVGYLYWALHQLPESVTALTVFAWVVCSLCGLTVMYTIRFFFVSLAIVFTKSDALLQVWYQVYRLATRPDAIYPSWLRVVVFTVLPIGFVTSVPARVLLGKDFQGIVAVSVCVASVMLFVSTRWWRFILTKYSSASS